jgi:polar amino acid transport system permease protein
MQELLPLLSLGPLGWGDELLLGAWHTALLALATLPVGIVLGLALALAKDSDEVTLRFLGHAATTIGRGLPELITLFIVFYGGQTVVREVGEALGLETVGELSPFLAGVIALGVVFAAYASEVFLSALKALARGPVEAARALGLGRWHSFRFIIAPELFRLSLPGLSNLWLGLLKQTSLVSVIAYDELLRASYLANASTHRPLFFYAVACLFYLGLTALSAGALERMRATLGRGIGAI